MEQEGSPDLFDSILTSSILEMEQTYLPYIGFNHQTRKFMKTTHNIETIPTSTIRDLIWPGYLHDRKVPMYSSPSMAKDFDVYPNTISMAICLDSSELGYNFHPSVNPTLFWLPDPKICTTSMNRGWEDIFEGAVEALRSSRANNKFLVLGGLGSIMFDSKRDVYKCRPTLFNSWYLPFSHSFMQLKGVPGVIIILLPILRESIKLERQWRDTVDELVWNLSCRPDVFDLLKRTYIVHTPSILDNICNHQTEFKEGGFQSMFERPDIGENEHKILFLKPAVFQMISDIILSKILDAASGLGPNLKYTHLGNLCTLKEWRLHSYKSFGKSMPYLDRILPCRPVSAHSPDALEEEHQVVHIPPPPSREYEIQRKPVEVRSVDRRDRDRDTRWPVQQNSPDSRYQGRHWKSNYGPGRGRRHPDERR